MRRSLWAALAVLGVCGSLNAAAAETVRAMPEDECQALARLVEADLGVKPAVSAGSVKRAPEIAGRACRVRWKGAGLDKGDQMQIVDRFFAHFLDWQPDFLISASGPNLEIQGFRKDRQLIVMSARWDAPNGTCKADAPGASCQVPATERVWTIDIDGMTSQP
ncbi:hypothetical protein [Microvirga pudoricolor]|uniref:hypothetical protein n=1 Tax=Microvirga pudoricolor TaxID=2778729 RepID=UPI00194FCD1E|nr:hypothetical protein [Microvirga pudoricolor]MBM6594357.1 hypothetical protein [Microvirga pudoricolor]